MDVDGVDSQEILRDVHQMFQAFMGGHASGISPRKCHTIYTLGFCYASLPF